VTLPVASQGDEEDQLRAVALQNAQTILAVRRRAEEELRKHSEWLRITLASIGDAVVSTDVDGRVTFMNPVAEALTGWRQDEALGLPLSDVFVVLDEGTRQPVENPALRVLQSGVVVTLTSRTILLSRAGIEWPIDDSAAPIRDEAGAIVGAVLVFRDVTDRQSTELSRAHLAAIVESSQDAVISMSMQGIILSWNGGAEQLFGYTSTEAMGRPTTIVIPPERLDEEREILARIARGERVEPFETVRVAKDGHRRHVSLTVSPMRDDAGEIIGASKIARDITDRKRAEEALREADNHKDRFIALLAHELRNPLAPLRSALQVMRLAQGDPGAVTTAREVMERQLGHMVRLIDDLLDISRIGQNKLELRRTRLLLADVVSSAVETARPVIDEAGHQLIVSLPAQPVHLDGDLTRLSQVLSNLLTNSAKYTDRGGRIQITAERRGGDAQICVSDNGIGIPTESLTSVFDMFSQVDRRSERPTGGLGIGLALVKGLVEMHGGTVTAASGGLGRGTTVTVTLPVLAAAGALSPDTAPAPEATLPGSRHRVLVVDDNHDGADSMAAMLQLMGNDVRTCYSGVLAATEVQAFRPGIVLMDIGMPELDGYEATRRIRAEPWGRDVVIIALTGWGQEKDRARSRDAGCDGHLVKPVEVAELDRLLVELRGGAGRS
jgi:PAS domain S-box-containing protein